MSVADLVSSPGAARRRAAARPRAAVAAWLRARGGRWPHPRTVDLLLAAGVAAATTVILATDGGRSEGHASPFAFVYVVGLGALMLVRRRWPLGTGYATFAALSLYYGLDYPPIGLAVPVSAALYSLAEAGYLRSAIGLVLGGLAVSSGFRLAEGGEDVGHVLGYELVSAAALMAAMVALGDSARSRRGWQAEVERRATQAAVEREREAQRRVEDERLRIARELHDVLAHTVSLISIQAQVAAEALAGGGEADGRAADAAVGVIRSASRDAMGELRSTLRLLRSPVAPGPLAPVAGLADLHRLVAYAAGSGLAVNVVTEGAPSGPLPVVVDAAAHRIVQEALTNVLRHARAATATVRLSHRPDGLLVRVEDDGVGDRRAASGRPGGAGGLAPVAGTGYGLRGMAERACVLGGHLRAGDRPQGGFAVEAWLPTGGGPGARRATPSGAPA